ncbi:MAG: DUF4129 domain-containing protein [Pirellulaceae bacterium]
MKASFQITHGIASRDANRGGMPKEDLSMKREKTSFDLIVIALNPILIVAMIASLVYFVTLCLYRGNFLGRINYILFLFIVAAVGIARIAIEEGRGRAMAYALALGGATLVSVMRFVGGGVFLAVGLLAMIWYLADRITFDCTVIDEQQDASGEGLLQNGLFGRKHKRESVDVSLDGTTTDNSASLTQHPSEGSDVDQASAEKRPRRPKQRHRPGMWILYLAFAAIPLYGLGQVAIPSDIGSRNAAIKSLGIYLGSSLLLLVTTSFLGMRRYLRQRGVDMPPGISLRWLGVGTMLVAGLLLFCFMLPLPGQLLASIELPASITSPDAMVASKFGWGDEGVKESGDAEPSANKGEEPNPDQQASGNEGKPQPKTSGGDQQQGEQGGDEAKGSASGGQSSDKQSGDKQSGDKQSGDKQSGDKQSGDKQSGDKQSGDKQSGDKQSGEQQKQQESGDSATSDDTQRQSTEEQRSETTEDSATSESAEDDGASASQSPPQESGGMQFSDLLPNLSGLLRFLIFAILAGIVLFYAMRHWDDIARWFRELMGLWGGDTDSETESEPSDLMQPAIRHRAFREYQNPLKDRSVSMEQSVIITFNALSAWARENGSPRDPETTPSEFVQQLAGRFPEHSQVLQLTGEMYNVVVYGNRQINPAHRSTLDKLWKLMQRPAQREAVS